MSCTLNQSISEEMLNAAKMQEEQEKAEMAWNLIKEKETPEQRQSRLEEEWKEIITKGILEVAAQHGRKNSKHIIENFDGDKSNLVITGELYTVIREPISHVNKFFPEELEQNCKRLAGGHWAPIGECIRRELISVDDLTEYSKKANGIFAAAYKMAIEICSDQPKWKVILEYVDNSILKLCIKF